MRKILEINADIEKKLVTVLDAALKSQGIAILETVQSLVQAVKEEQEGPKLEDKKEV